VETCDRPWTSWYNRDKPSGSGDLEPINLANPLPCGGETPLDIECRTTIRGIDAAIAGEVIICDHNYGLKCVNEDQPDGRCNFDYKVKYQCCGPECERTWSNWYDRDDPLDTGDWELLNDLTGSCGGSPPLDIECQTTTGIDAVRTGEIVTCDPSFGFLCLNKDQPDGRCNYDYKVRFLCCGPPCERTWTNWYDRDDPSDSGDREPLSLATPVPCGGDAPVAIECKTTTGIDWRSTGEIVTCDRNYGFKCENKDQPDGRCNYDYKVRYLCECNN